ncbi:MAG: SNF2-related protein [Thermodesulfobacteriota bacterium]|nr:SNF2-related protein [Thermodesulfobacteriota bacterium]
MAKKKKSKRKKTPKKHGKPKDDYARFKRAYYFFNKGIKHWDAGRLQQALICILKAVKAKPPEIHNMFEALVELGREMERKDVVLQGYAGLLRTGHLAVEEYPPYINSIIDEKKYNEAITIIKEYRRKLSWKDLPKKEMVKQLHQASSVEQYCKDQIKRKQSLKKGGKKKKTPEKNVQPRRQKKRPGQSLNHSAIKSEQRRSAKVGTEKQKPGPSVPDNKKTDNKKKPAAIPVTIKLDNESFFSTLEKSETVRPETLHVTIDAHRISFRNSFENLICPPLLHNVESFWYQEETVRKVLKTFRGRAMLADEVGLGKTIEAGMVLKEYIERGMVKSVLILTPTPLVSQWQEELQVKFDLDFVSTDDRGVRINDEFWRRPFVLASINQAKSKKNFSNVTARQYDMVIVDEAHHLKNRNTLNWKLVNSLKKRFLLFLTATPVENNLIELYNLITLLKPGLLKTASEFKKEFMNQGDAVSPRNRTRLRSLLDQVMIRNTRALAALNIPPRFAQTVQINPVGEELKLYEMVTSLACSINESGRRMNRMLLKNLLAEAGSSPRALSLTLRRLLERDDDWLNDFRDRIEVIRNLCRSITGETGKNKALGKLLKNTRGKKIVFVKYIGSMDEISDYLSWHDVSFVTFHGSMSNRKKDEAIESFRDEKDILITTEIGGEGRNLQFCHQMINYDLPWNPMKIEQRIGRIHRLGQQNEVMIYNFCGKGSLEEYILEILDKKINMFEMVIGEIDMILGRVRGEKDFEDMVYEIWVNSDSPEMRGREFAKLGTRIKRSKTQYGNTRELDEKLFGDDYEL